MDGRWVFKMATTKMVEVTSRSSRATACARGDLSLVLMQPGQPPHQRVRAEGARAAGWQGSSTTSKKYGNTTAATIPLLWDESLPRGPDSRPGNYVLTVAFAGHELGREPLEGLNRAGGVQSA